MKYFTAKEIQAFDRRAIEEIGIPSLCLMENAGCALAVEVLKVLRRQRKVEGQVVVICGLGNNGGDGMVAARHLVIAGARVKVFLLGDAKKLKGDPSVHWKILQKMKLPIKEKAGLVDLSRVISKADVIVDAIFGIGLTREVSGLFAEVIARINQSKKYVVAADIPSGLDATTGKVLGTAIRARKTVTFGSPKIGMTKNYGPRYCGGIVVDRIGLYA